MSTVLTEAFVCLFNFVYLAKSLGLKLPLRLGLKGLLATLGMGWGIQLLLKLALPWWLILPLAILLYAGLLFALRTLSKGQTLAIQNWSVQKFKAYTGKKHA